MPLAEVQAKFTVPGKHNISTTTNGLTALDGLVGQIQVQNEERKRPKVKSKLPKM